MPSPIREAIDDFLAQRRIAFAGVSRNPSDYSRSLFTEFVRRGYDLIPVNPNLTDVDGRPAVASVSAINPPPDAALLLTTPGLSEQIVVECAAAGIKRVWMRRGSQKAIDSCRAHGISVVAGECPFMYLPQGQWFHRLHGFFSQKR